MPYKKATEEEIDAALANLEGWTRATDRISKTYRFASFVEAFGWMSSVALVAERMAHHPEWKNVWATVEVELSTHDCGGLSSGDFGLAEEMDRLAALAAAG